MKTALKISSFALILFFTISFSSCSEDLTNPAATENPDGENGGVTGVMSAKINGDPWAAATENFANILNEDQQSGNQILIDGKDANGIRIILSASGDVPGAYVLDAANNMFNAGASIQLVKNGSQYIGQSVKSTVTLTAVDKTAKRVSGTFSFKTDDDQYTITEGQFKDLSFTIQ